MPPTIRRATLADAAVGLQAAVTYDESGTRVWLRAEVARDDVQPVHLQAFVGLTLQAVVEVAGPDSLRGRRYVSPSIAERMAEADLDIGIGSGAGAPLRSLSTREREVLQLLAEGKSMKQVAAVLAISPRTVEFHKYRIMDLLGVTTGAELVQYAIKHGLIGP